jgi:hypothetical protein
VSSLWLQIYFQTYKKINFFFVKTLKINLKPQPQLRFIAAQHVPDLEENIRNHLTLYSGPHKDTVSKDPVKISTTKGAPGKSREFSSKDSDFNRYGYEEQEEYEQNTQQNMSTKGTQPTTNEHDDEEEEGFDESEDQHHQKQQYGMRDHANHGGSNNLTTLRKEKDFG